MLFRFMFHVPGFEFQVPCFEFQVLSFSFRETLNTSPSLVHRFLARSSEAKARNLKPQSMATWKSFEDIEVWQLSRNFCQKIFISDF